MRIGIYPRKSVYKDNSDSISVQVQMCRDYANIIYKDKEIEFVIYDKDEGFSGKNTNRPSFKMLMNDVLESKIDAVIVYKLDRISRNVQEFSSMYETFREHNVSFISVKESFDTSTPMGRTVMYILAAFAQLERENTSERVADNMLALGASGKWTGGKLPAGMSSERKIVNGKEHSFLNVNQKTIGQVKMLYKLLLDGYSITGIERHCKENGIKSSSGKFLNTSQIYNIITNPVYCTNDMEAYYFFKNKGHKVPNKSLFDGNKGLIAYGRTSQSSATVKNEQYTIAIGQHEPVMQSIEWISAQERLGKNKMYRSNKYEIGILKGIIKCECGSRIDIRNYKKNGIMFSYYYCAKMARQGKEYCNSGYFRVDKIDKLFIEQFKKIKADKELLDIRIPGTPIIDIKLIEENIRDLDNSIENLTKTLMTNMNSSASSYIIKQIETLDKEKSKLIQNYAELEMRNRLGNNQLMTKNIIYNNVCALIENFENMTYLEKNELIKKTVKSCVLNDHGLIIEF